MFFTRFGKKRLKGTATKKQTNVAKSKVLLACKGTVRHTSTHSEQFTILKYK